MRAVSSRRSLGVGSTMFAIRQVISSRKVRVVVTAETSSYKVGSCKRGLVKTITKGVENKIREYD